MGYCFATWTGDFSSTRILRRVLTTCNSSTNLIYGSPLLHLGRCSLFYLILEYQDTLETRKRKRSRAPGAYSSHSDANVMAAEAQEITTHFIHTRKQKALEKAPKMGSASASTRRSGRIHNLGDASSLQQTSEGQLTEKLPKHRKARPFSDKENDASKLTGDAISKQKRPGRPQKPRGSSISGQRANAVPASAKPQQEKAGLRQKGSLGNGRESGTDDADGKGDAWVIPPYRKLVTHTRLIALKTMTSKWAPLEQEALAAVQTVLADCARPVLSHVGAAKGSNSERRQEQCRLAISATTRRLRSKLTKGIPFPPAAGHIGRITKASRRGGTRESDFDFDSTLECVKALEQQLNPLQHSITLLEGQRRREERTLEADYAALRQLETNAQAETRTWRDRTRRLHVLAPADDKAPQPTRFQTNVELSERPGSDREGGIYQVRILHAPLLPFCGPVANRLLIRT